MQHVAGYSIKCIETRHGTKQKWVCKMILPEMTFWGLGKNPAVKKKTCSGCPGFNGPMPGLQVAQPQRQVRLLRPKGLTAAG